VEFRLIEEAYWRGAAPVSCATPAGKLERSSTDNGSQFRSRAFDAEFEQLRVTHTLIGLGQPQSNGFADRVQRTILRKCWKPSFARELVPKYMGLRLELGRSCSTTTTTAPTMDATPKSASRQRSYAPLR
jgi:transposase InsO family protein